MVTEMNQLNYTHFRHSEPEDTKCHMGPTGPSHTAAIAYQEACLNRSDTEMLLRPVYITHSPSWEYVYLYTDLKITAL